MTAWRLIHYFDVWGNAKEGFDVNNACTQAELHFAGHDRPTEAEVLKELKRIGFFRKSIRLASVRFNYNCAEMYEIEGRDGCPICRLDLLDPSEYGDAWHLEGSYRDGGPRRVQG